MRTTTPQTQESNIGNKREKYQIASFLLTIFFANIKYENDRNDKVSAKHRCKRVRGRYKECVYMCLALAFHMQVARHARNDNALHIYI